MNRRLLEATLAILPPETRRAVNWARFQMAAQGMEDEEFARAVMTLGYLARLLTGQHPFDRLEFCRYVNMTENDRKRPKRKAKAVSSGPAE